MIDTEKYKGHIAYDIIFSDFLDGHPGDIVGEYEGWTFSDFMNIKSTHEERSATEALLNDAPLLLSEYKRLQKRNESLEKVLQLAQQYGSIDLPKLIANKFHNFWVFNSPVGEEE